jgi:hypothetical protein
MKGTVYDNLGEAGEAGEAEELEPEDVFLARLEKIRAKAEEDAKPKIVASVSAKMAEAIKANPETFRVSARGADETVVVDRPRRTEVIEVMDEPTVDGKLRRAWRIDCATGERSVIEFEGGYRQPNVVAHQYDPLSALKGDGND